MELSSLFWNCTFAYGGRKITRFVACEATQSRVLKSPNSCNVLQSSYEGNQGYTRLRYGVFICLKTREREDENSDERVR